ncbi:hypothetical protein B0T25DRAFT_249569 [Lasiosphaeria hispida]|uniref:F-box domain-containing protein n=1 Tax=Lasiosphaeria hispida TaxID=260671 RepID=A0AAJ0HFT0_9PEZI|nr:hypothetical protein B0T25DRAFT_249569 [Lasiosphaeria hispida]
METPRAPAPAVSATLSPPPSLIQHVGESHDRPDEADLDFVMTVQLASKTSHLTLSTSGVNAEGSTANAAGSIPCAIQLPNTLICSPTMTPIVTPTDDAQLCSKIAQTRRTEEGQDSTRSTPMEEVSAPSIELGMSSMCCSGLRTAGTQGDAPTPVDKSGVGSMAMAVGRHTAPAKQLLDLPNEVLLQILSNLEVCDLLATSRTSHHLLPAQLSSPWRPSLADLMRRHIFLTKTTVVSRQLARSLVAIRLARRLAARPSPQALVERCVLPAECVPYSYRGGYSGAAAGEGGGEGPAGAGVGSIPVAPALVAKRRAIERERVKDGLRRWVGSVWRGEVRSREEGMRRWEERVGVGRVWRLRRFWETLGNEGGQGQGGGR